MVAHLEVAGVDPSCQLVHRLVQPGFVLLHVRGAARVIEIVDEILADLQPTANIFLQYLLVKIVHVVMILHRALGRQLPEPAEDRRQGSVGRGAVERKRRGERGLVVWIDV